MNIRVERASRSALASQHPWFVALCLALLLALVQFSSNGIVRGGDEDKGSGIGGTGRTLLPAGEGGIGGTGRKPYLGMSENQEVEIRHDPLLRTTALTQSLTYPPATPPPALPGVPRVATIMHRMEVTRDSGPIAIGEAIQASLDIDALMLTQLRTELTAAIKAEIPTLQAETANWEELAQVLAHLPRDSHPGSVLVPEENNGEMDDASQMAQTDPGAEDSMRVTRQERLQRPQLPPMQRVSPLQRAALLPPRIQPMHL